MGEIWCLKEYDIIELNGLCSDKFWENFGRILEALEGYKTQLRYYI